MSHNIAHIDLYQAHGLDRRRSSPELASALATQLAYTTDAVTHRRIEVASAILGDVNRRAAYDSRLADPQAPPITEDALAQLAAMPSLPASESTPNIPQPAAGGTPTPVRVVVVPGDGSRKREFWADAWQVIYTDDGATLTVTGTGDGVKARKSKKDSSLAEWIGGAAGAIFGA